jgi:hypothetical protein
VPASTLASTCDMDNNSVSSTRRRISLGFTAAAMCAATVVPGTAARAATDIPAFAFDDCPAIPADVDPAAWRCEEMHASGSIRLGAVEVPMVLRTTHAEGRRPGEQKTEFIFGALRANPVPVPGGLLGTPARHRRSPVTAVTVAPEYAGHIDFVAGPPMAEILHLRYRVSNRLLGDDCSIGTEDEPLVVAGEIVGDRVPVQDDPQVLRFTVVDDDFAVPGSHGCGPSGRLVDRRFGLPSNGALTLTVYFSIRTYDRLI